jgi:hypothetical protein
MAPPPSIFSPTYRSPKAPLAGALTSTASTEPPNRTDLKSRPRPVQATSHPGPATLRSTKQPEVTIRVVGLGQRSFIVPLPAVRDPSLEPRSTGTEPGRVV